MKYVYWAERLDPWGWTKYGAECDSAHGAKWNAHVQDAFMNRQAGFVAGRPWRIVRIPEVRLEVVEMVDIQVLTTEAKANDQ